MNRHKNSFAQKCPSIAEMFKASAFSRVFITIVHQHFIDFFDVFQRSHLNLTVSFEGAESLTVASEKAMICPTCAQTRRMLIQHEFQFFFMISLFSKVTKIILLDV